MPHAAFKNIADNTIRDKYTLYHSIIDLFIVSLTSFDPFSIFFMLFLNVLSPTFLETLFYAPILIWVHYVLLKLDCDSNLQLRNIPEKVLEEPFMPFKNYMNFLSEHLHSFQHFFTVSKKLLVRWSLLRMHWVIPIFPVQVLFCKPFEGVSNALRIGKPNQTV